MTTNEMETAAPSSAHGSPHGDDRRNFLSAAMAFCVGALATLVPAVVGVFAFLDPLRRTGDDARRLRITTLDALPDDGVPRRFPVQATRTDAWSQLPSEPIGAVYLRRMGDEVTAHNAVCPHAGCFVEFRDSPDIYQCPCHDSRFEPDGARIDPETCPAPRDLDSLAVDVDDNGEVWVEFENFRAGTQEKMEEA